MTFGDFLKRKFKRKSSVAGIVDKAGGLRVVVAKRNTFHHHVGEGEKLFVVPNYKVHEPVPFYEVPALIARVEEFVRKNNK